jgi:uncharacterized protein YprB with RNaseH-like and TPR domain
LAALEGEAAGPPEKDPPPPLPLWPRLAGRLLFFDLETTGLSGGAGTVAFLAALGRFGGPAGGAGASLEITQFLLLDYPGEADFLEGILAFLREPASPGPPILVTYNGKTFDYPLLKTRCLMNGLPLPLLPQADLLHPARRLWKRVLPDCSQATIEREVLGLDRAGDIPGALAPEIWFAFLRAGGKFDGPRGRELLNIAGHNIRDIAGLAALFRVFLEIAAAPLEAVRRFNCDGENLALCYRTALRRGEVPAAGMEGNPQDGPGGRETAALRLLEAAAAVYPRSCLRLGFEYLRRGRLEEGRAALRRAAGPLPGGPGDASWRVPPGLVPRALALRALALDAVKRLGRRDLALALVERALALEGEAPPGQAGGALPRGLREDLEKRRRRLAGGEERSGGGKEGGGGGGEAAEEGQTGEGGGAGKEGAAVKRPFGPPVGPPLGP